MRPISASAPVLALIERAPDVVTSEWLRRRTGLSSKIVLRAIRLAKKRGLLTWLSRGQYLRLGAA